MKNKIYGCYCCDVHRDLLSTPCQTQCADCIRLGRTQTCYHHPVSDANWRERLAAERDLQVEAFPHLARMPFSRRSLLRITNYAMHKAAVDPFNIDFQPRNIRQKAQFWTLIESEFRLKGIAFDNNAAMDVLKNEIHEFVLVEKSFELLSDVLSEVNNDAAMIPLEQALSCLLHLENRTLETIIEHRLHRGMNIQQDCTAEQQNLMIGVEDIINEQFFGTYSFWSNWKFPVNKDGSMGQIKYANWRARRIIENLSTIIDLCLPGDH
jgi:hypothetical protein